MLTPPWYQRVAIPAGSVFGGLLLLGAGLDAVSNARTLVSPFITYGGSAFLIVSAAILHLYLRMRPILWVSDDGQGVRVSGLSRRLLGAMGGAILLLWVPRFIDVLPLARALGTTDPGLYLIEDADADHDGGSASPIPSFAGWWCYTNLLDVNDVNAGETHGIDDGEWPHIAESDELYIDETEGENDAVRKFSTFLMANEGGIVRLNMMVCPNAVLHRNEQPRANPIPDTIRIGAWPEVGLDLVIQEQENGDIVWDPLAMQAYNSMRGYFVVLETLGNRQSEWLTVRVRPIRIEDALRSGPNPLRPQAGSRPFRGG